MSFYFGWEDLTARHFVDDNKPHYNQVSVSVDLSKIFVELQNKTAKPKLLHNYHRNPNVFEVSVTDDMKDLFLTGYSEPLVRFNVEEAAGFDGRRHVTGGVPLNPGTLAAADVDLLQLLDESGETIGFTPTITARWSWPDGDVQWLLLDFTADFEAGQNRQFTLVRGEAKANAGVDLLKIRETPQAIEINTGEIAFSVSRQQFSFMAGVDYGGTVMTADTGGDLVVDMLQAVPAETDEENWLRRAPQGEVARLSARASNDYEAEVEFQNDRRAVIKITGTLSQARESSAQTEATFPYTVRLTVRAGDSRVQVQQTLLYDGDVERETIRRIGLSVPLAGEATPLHAMAAGQGGDPLAGESEKPARASRPERSDDIHLDMSTDQILSLLSVGPEKRFHDAPIYDMARIDYTIDRIGGGDTKTMGSGDSSRGWITAGDDQRTVYTALRDFWRLHPKELAVDARGRSIHIWTWPDRGEVVLDGRRHSEKKVYEALREGEGWRYEGESQDIGYFFGRAISNELVVDFDTAELDPNRADRLAAELNEPLYVMAEPVHYQQNEVIGPIAPYNPHRFPRLEGIQEVFLEWMMRNQRVYGWYGLIDYGDILMEYDWFHVRNWGDQREGWLNRGYSGWLNNDSQVDHTLYLHALRRGDRELFKFAEAMTRHVGDIDTPHLEMPLTEELEVGINDNRGRSRVGGASRHNSQHWGDYVKARGSASQGLAILYGMTGDERLRDIMKSVASFHMHHDSYENHDGLGGLAAFYHFLGDEKLIERAWEVRPQYERSGFGFGFFNNRVISMWRYWQSTRDETVKNQLVQTSEELNAIRATGESYPMYGQGFVETLAWHLTGDKRNIEHISQAFLWISDDQRAYDQVDLSGAMNDGARKLSHSELWQRVQSFQPITPEKMYHFHGIILQKFPFVLTGLKDESFLDQ